MPKNLDKMVRTQCDGMPYPAGCPNEIYTTRPYVKVGKKSTGWLVTYYQNDDGSDDKSGICVFCPSCAAIVEEHDRAARS